MVLANMAVRILTYGYGFFICAFTLREQGRPFLAPLLVLGVLFGAWIAAACILSLRSINPKRTEFLHMLIDGFNVGFAVTVISFDLYPAVAILLGFSHVCLAFGGPVFYLRALLFLAAGIGIGGVSTGFTVRFTESLELYLLSIPHLVLYICAISYLSHTRYRSLVKRKAQLQWQKKLLETANEKLEIASLTDYLTGLRNRRYIQQIIPNDIAFSLREYRAFAKGEKQAPPEESDIAFLIIDMDHFKNVNDVHGHEAGDAVLVQLSQILTDQCRESDVVIRWGGEEFLVVARHIHRDRVAAMAERIREAVERHGFDIGNGRKLRLTCSVGLAVYPFLPHLPDLLNWEQVVNVADQALYLAKKGQRNAWVGILPGHETDKELLTRLIQHDLRKLVEEKVLTIATSMQKQPFSLLDGEE